ncbi:MAG: hypothetical protein R2867_21305 [Caldilineaceae bacterium]
MDLIRLRVQKRAVTQVLPDIGLIASRRRCGRRDSRGRCGWGGRWAGLGRGADVGRGRRFVGDTLCRQPRVGRRGNSKALLAATSDDTLRTAVYDQVRGATFPRALPTVSCATGSTAPGTGPQLRLRNSKPRYNRS